MTPMGKVWLHSWQVHCQAGGIGGGGVLERVEEEEEEEDNDVRVGADAKEKVSSEKEMVNVVLRFVGLGVKMPLLPEDLGIALCDCCYLL